MNELSDPKLDYLLNARRAGVRLASAGAIVATIGFASLFILAMRATDRAQLQKDRALHSEQILEKEILASRTAASQVTQLTNELQQERSRLTCILKLFRSGIIGATASEITVSPSLFSSVLDCAPDDPTIINAKSYALFKTGRIDDAIALQKRGNEIDPSYFWGAFDLTRFSCAAGQATAAQENGSHLLSNWPDKKSIIATDVSFKTLCIPFLPDLNVISDDNSVERLPFIGQPLTLVSKCGDNAYERRCFLPSLGRRFDLSSMMLVTDHADGSVAADISFSVPHLVCMALTANTSQSCEHPSSISAYLTVDEIRETRNRNEDDQTNRSATLEKLNRILGDISTLCNIDSRYRIVVSSFGELYIRDIVTNKIIIDTVSINNSLLDALSILFKNNITRSAIDDSGRKCIESNMTSVFPLIGSASGYP